MDQQGESSDAGMRRSQRPKRPRVRIGEEGEEDDGFLAELDPEGGEGLEEDYFEDEGSEGDDEEDDDDSDEDYEPDGEDQPSQPPAQQQQHGQQQQGAPSSSQRAFVTNPHICVDYAALTREYEQRGVESQQLFPQYAETILQLTQKANKRQRKSRSKKKPGADDDEDGAGMGGAGRKKKKRRGSKMSQSQQYQDLFGEAQTHYMKGMLGNALDVVNQLLFMKHYTPQLASLRSQISEELGHKEAAAEWCLVASRLGKTDASLWKKAGQLYLELGPQGHCKAQYCFGRAVKLNKSDYETLADRALVFSLDNNIARALAYYEQVLAIKPPEPEVFLLRMAEDCFRERKFWPRGTELVFDVMSRCFGTAFMSKQTDKAFPHLKPSSMPDKYKLSKEKVTFAFEAAHVFCRHLMSTHLHKYEQAAAVIQVCNDFIDRLRNQESRFLSQESVEEVPVLPLDLAVQYGICMLHLDKVEPALRCFKPLQDVEPDQVTVVDLLEEVAGSFSAKGMHLRALNLLRKVDVHLTHVVVEMERVRPSQPDGPAMVEVEKEVPLLSAATSARLQLKLARCFLAVKKPDQAKHVAQQVMVENQDQEGMQPAVLEAVLVWSMAMRAQLKLQPPAGPQELRDCLEVVAQQLRASTSAPPPTTSPATTGTTEQPAPSQEQQPPPPRQGPLYEDPLLAAARERLKRPSSSARGGAAAAAGGGSSGATGIEVEGGEEPPQQPGEASSGKKKAGTGRKRGKRRWQTLGAGVADEPTTMPVDWVVFELILEFGLLSRELGKLEDFFTACLSLIELAVFQSKQRFREDANTVMEVEESGPGKLPSLDRKNRIPHILTRSWQQSPMQKDIEAHVMARGYSHTVVSMLGEERVMEALRALVDTCMAAGMMREACTILKYVVKRKRLLSPEHLKELANKGAAANAAAASAAVSSSSAGGGQPSSAAARSSSVSSSAPIIPAMLPGDDVHGAIRQALSNAQSDPHNVELLNGLCRLLHEAGGLDPSVRLYIRRLSQNNPASTSLSMLAGHNFAASRNFKCALDKYLSVFRLASSEDGSGDRSLAALSAAILLLRVLGHKKMEDRHGCITKALAFLEEYAMLRKADDPRSTEDREAGGPDMSARVSVSLQQEVLYNTGRAFQQAGLLHMAVHFYSDALSLFESQRAVFEALGSKGHVTREAAHNLAVIFRESGNRDRAALLTSRFLTV